jgi:hypothetical protein
LSEESSRYRRPERRPPNELAPRVADTRSPDPLDTLGHKGENEQMTFRMDVRVERVLEEGIYDAVLDNVEMKDTKNGERLMWTFRIPDEDDTTVVGWSSLSPSTRAKSCQWAAVLMGEIDPKIGWGPEDVIGRECRVVLSVYEDGQGVEKNGVDKVLRSKAGDPKAPF